MVLKDLMMIITAVLIIIGWFVINKLSYKRIVKQKRFELRLKYLLEVYNDLRYLAIYNYDPSVNYTAINKFRRIINNIHLFGNKEQIESVHRGLKEGEITNYSFNNLNSLIVKEIREEIGQPFDENRLGREIVYEDENNFEIGINNEKRFNKITNCYKQLLTFRANLDMVSIQEVRSILQDLWIWGTKEQLILAMKIIDEEKINIDELDKLLKILHRSIRNNLDMKVLENVLPLKIFKNKNIR